MLKSQHKKSLITRHWEFRDKLYEKYQDVAYTCVQIMGFISAATSIVTFLIFSFGVIFLDWSMNFPETRLYLLPSIIAAIFASLVIGIIMFVASLLLGCGIWITSYFGQIGWWIFCHRFEYIKEWREAKKEKEKWAQLESKDK